MYDFKKVEQFLDDVIALGVPGCQVQVKKGHETLFCARRGEGSFDSRYFLYSCSKVMTVTGMMRLIEQGRASLEDPVSRYVPAFRDVFIERDGIPCPPEKEMTLRHLFTMTAGLDYDLSAPGILEAVQKSGTTFDVVSAIPKKALSFSPGDRYQYSLCHDVLGAVIESITGMTFGDYMQKEIFAPLGMKGTSFLPDGTMAPQYCFDTETRKYIPHPLTCAYRLSPIYHSGGAGIISTLEDMSRFAAALTCGKGPDGYHLLNRESIDLLRKEQLSSVAKDPSFGCCMGPGYGYALGLRTLVDKSQGQKSPIGEFGWDGAAGSFILCDPQNDVSVVYTMHVLNWYGIRDVFHVPLRDAVYDALNL